LSHTQEAVLCEAVPLDQAHTAIEVCDQCNAPGCLLAPLAHRCRLVSLQRVFATTPSSSHMTALRLLTTLLAFRQGSSTAAGCDVSADGKFGSVSGKAEHKTGSGRGSGRGSGGAGGDLRRLASIGRLLTLALLLLSRGVFVCCSSN
jgi:hypothetical protein